MKTAAIESENASYPRSRVFSDLAELEKVYSELAVQRLYIGFDVERVVVKSQMDDGIWDTWAELPLMEVEGNC